MQNITLLCRMKYSVLVYHRESLPCIVFYCDVKIEKHISYPSYKTIGQALKMSKNTVRKYIQNLEEKHLIETEKTEVYTKTGQKRNGTLLYTIRPIAEAIDYFHSEQLRRNA